jgi:hypothetical protein
MTVTAAAGSMLKPAVVMRTTACDKDDTPPFCFDLSPTSESIAMDLKAGNYWFIVSGQGGTNGAFHLTAALTTGVCGDGVVNPGEQCDLGTPWPMNSGCIPPGSAQQCQFMTNNQPCPGHVVQVAANATNFLADTGNTTGYMDNNSSYINDGTCNTPGMPPPAGQGAPERVYQLMPMATGMMTVTVGNDTGNMKSFCAESNNMPTVDCWEYTLYARTNCSDTTTELACSQPAAGPATITFPVTVGTPYFVFVDGLMNDNLSYGYYNLYVALQ